MRQRAEGALTYLAVKLIRATCFTLHWHRARTRDGNCCSTCFQYWP